MHGPWGSGAATDPPPAATRTEAEARVERVLEWLGSAREQALLFWVMRCAGWSTDRARSVLERERWWLG